MSSFAHVSAHSRPLGRGMGTRMYGKERFLFLTYRLDNTNHTE